MAKSRLLFPEFARYRAINFEKSNENPNANITRKSKALELLEASTVDILKYGTPKQVALARQALHAAYLNFGETLEKSAFPKGLAEVDKEALKKSFQEAAQQMRQKAQEFVAAPKDKAEKTDEKSNEEDTDDYPNLAGKEFKELITRAANDPKDAESFAKLAWHMFDKGEYATARYVATKWEAALKKGASPSSKFGPDAHSAFWKSLTRKIPMLDPVVVELNSDTGFTQQAAVE
jgi:hypothetical protein